MLLCFCFETVCVLLALDFIGKNCVMNIHALGGEQSLAKVFFSRLSEPQKKLLKVKILMKNLSTLELLKLPQSFSF